jgi:hypothetical protein
VITTSGRNPNGGQGDGTYRSSARAVATELYTLGGVRVSQQGSALDVNLGAKHLALLIYLFQERRPMHPFEVVELLGHGQGYDRELDGLKRTVKWLNQAVPFVNIRITSDTIEGLSGVWLDTMDMDAAIDAKKPVRVAQMYVGEFLEGFESGVQAFDEWAKKERGRLKRAWDHAMTRAAHEAGRAGKWRTAAEWWRIVVSRAPMRSEPVAHLLEAYARTGRREEAAQAYADYTERLRRSGVSDVPGVVKQVVARFPLLQRIAAKPQPQTIVVKPQTPQTPTPERPLPPWDLEPAPAPPDAFDLTFELPEVEIPVRPGPSRDASPARREVSTTDSTRASSTRTFHVLDEPVRAEFGVGTAVDRTRRPAQELVVETVAMSFEKIAARASNPDPSDGNGGAGAGEADSPSRPEGFGDNSVDEGQSGNGAPPPRAESQVKGRTEPASEPRGDAEAKGEAPHSGDAEEAAVKDPTPGKPQSPVRHDDKRYRDLYRSTASILAAFVDDDGEAIVDGGNAWVGEAAPPPDTILVDGPAEDAPDPWDDFAKEPGESEAAETEPAAPSGYGTTPSGGTTGVTWEPPPQEPPPQREGQALLFEDSYSAEPDNADLDADEAELYCGQVARVRHHVTSVRKPWGPVLRDAWSEISEWIAHAFGGFRARLQRSPIDEQRIDAEERSDVAEYFEPWATDETAYTSTHDDSEPFAREAPPSVTGDEAVETRRDGPPVDDAVEASEAVYQEIEEEAPVEWYEWEHGTTDGAFDEPYEVERDVGASAAKSASREAAGATSLAWLLRRHWYAPLGAIVVVAALAFGPGLIGLLGGGGAETAGSEELSTPKPSRPKITVRTPAFVQTSISKISQLLSGSILDAPGEWVVVADVQSRPTDEGASIGSAPASGEAVTSDALTVALEDDLMQARFFFVFPRGRALAALRASDAETSQRLSREDALSLAAAEGISAVITGTLYRETDGDSLVLEVLRPDGRSAYRISGRVADESGRLATLNELTRAVRRRLGEPAEDIETSVPIRTFLSDNPQAVIHYAEAVERFRAERYREASQAARAATRQDSTFAVAYGLLARSLAAIGARRQARAALQAAVGVSERATERERLRILGDWLAWTGRLSDAAFTYDELFERHRDDVGALRSQAVVQRLVGAPGEGLGNLRVAYTIDRHDWPSLATLAQYLGYRGSLPSTDSLQATSPSAPSPEPDE